MEIPPNPPVDNLVGVNPESLENGDTLYIWFEFSDPQWSLVKFIEIDDWGLTKFLRVEPQSKIPPFISYNLNFLDTNRLRLFKQRKLDPVLEEKYLRQKYLALKNSPIGFEGPPMNTISQMLGLKKLPPGTLKERRRRRKSRRQTRKTGGRRCKL